MNARLRKIVRALRAAAAGARAAAGRTTTGGTVASPTSLKMTREALSFSQTGMGATEQGRRYLRIIQGLIDDIDRQRPLGSGGKHGSRHTATCGCDDR